MIVLFLGYMNKKKTKQNKKKEQEFGSQFVIVVQKTIIFVLIEVSCSWRRKLFRAKYLEKMENHEQKDKKIQPEIISVGCEDIKHTIKIREVLM